jgi:hypothetical protein
LSSRSAQVLSLSFLTFSHFFATQAKEKAEIDDFLSGASLFFFASVFFFAARAFPRDFGVTLGDTAQGSTTRRRNHDGRKTCVRGRAACEVLATNNDVASCTHFCSSAMRA